MERFDTYCTVYNSAINQMRGEVSPSERHKYQTIKSVHRALFEDMVNQVKGQMNKFRGIFNGNSEFLGVNPCLPYILHTNRVVIGKRTGKDGATVWRNIQRLIEAGVIVRKVNHGPRSNFELHINPVFLLISDMENPENAPIELTGNDFAMDTENGLFQGVSRAKCTPIEKDLNTFNNKINHVDTELEGVASNNQSGALLGTDMSIYLTKGKLSDFSSNGSPKNEKNAQKIEGGGRCEVSKSLTYAEKLQKQDEAIARRIQLYSQWLVQLLIKTLFPNHKHFAGTIDKAVEFAAIYFTGCKTQVEFDNRMNCLMWRVDAAARWVKRTGFKFDNIFVHTYLDVNNKTSGFVNTAKWWKMYKERERKKETAANIKRLKSDRQKLMQAVNILDEAYLNLPTSKLVAKYREQEAYVKRNVPHLLPDFYKITDYVRKDRYQQAKKTA